MHRWVCSRFRWKWRWRNPFNFWQMYVCVCGGRGRGFNKTLLQQQSRGEKADSAVHYELLISKVVGERSTHNIRRSRQTSYILHGHTFSHTCSEERSHAPPPTHTKIKDVAINNILWISLVWYVKQLYNGWYLQLYKTADVFQLMFGHVVEWYHRTADFLRISAKPTVTFMQIKAQISIGSIQLLLDAKRVFIFYLSNYLEDGKAVVASESETSKWL